MSKTQWKPIPGFERYEVSNHGDVRRVFTGRLLKRQKSSGRGHMIQLSKDGVVTTMRLARLVGAAFCPDFDPELVPEYRNGNAGDCRACNLRWVPRSEITGKPYSKNPR